MTSHTKKELKNQDGVNSKQAGVTLLLALLVLSSILAISFSLATILFVEVRTSGDLMRTEPALYGAEAVTEEALYKIKRQVPEGSLSYTTRLGNVNLNDPAPAEFSTTSPVFQDVVPPGTNFSNTPKHYILGPSDPQIPTSGSNYGKVKITYLSTGNTSTLKAYICEYNPSLPYDPSGGFPSSYKTIVCSDPNSDEYWLSDGKDFSLSPSGYANYTWTLDNSKQQEIILFNAGTSGSIYVQIEAFGPSPAFVPQGLPYVGVKAVEINADNAGVKRKIRVEIPIGGSTSGGGGAPAPVALINAGGGSYTNAKGTWTDTGSSGGSIASTADPISGTSDQTLYQTVRYGNFSYTIGGLTSNTAYTAILKFAEMYWTAVGQRVFNVNINGSPVLTNFDIFQQAGGHDIAIDKTFSVTSNGSGQIVIQFITVTDNAMVNAIEIDSSGGGGGDTTPPTVSITNPSGGSTVSGSSVVLTANASDDVGVTGVQFKVDGGDVGSEDLSAPFVASWDTTASSNGSYSITAVARDAAGNTTTSNPVNVTVNNLPWYNIAWGYRKAITVNASQVSGTHSNFPVLVNFASDADLAARAQVDFDDILFTDSNGTTKIPHEIEKYDKGTGQLIAWVKVPSINDSSNTTIYMYYGNGSAGNQQDVAGTWDSNYKGVWHLGNGTTLGGADSTSNGKTIVFSGTPTAVAMAGKIDGAAQVATTNMYSSSRGISNLLGMSSARTIEGWVYLVAPHNADTDFSTIFGVSSNADYSNAEGHYVGFSFLNLTANFRAGASDNNNVALTSYSTLSTGTWYHAVAAYSGTQLKFYLNGALVNSANFNGTIADGYMKVQGLRYGRPYNFDVDELRASSGERSASWILTEYRNQNTPASFITKGLQETP